MPNTLVPAAAEGLPGFQHPKFQEARRLLNIAPELEKLDIADDDVRIIAGEHALRRLAEEAAEKLIDLLDELEGDVDLEPSLGYSPYLSMGEVDLEDEHDGREPDPDGEDNGDAEPSLGSIEVGHCWSANWDGVQSRDVVGVDQTGWGHGATDDAEADWSDHEPSLGWTDREAASGKHIVPSVVDVEGPDDNGIADADGLQEQFFCGAMNASAYFDGSGHRLAEEQLAAVAKRP